jgi:hypothetical protein
LSYPSRIETRDLDALKMLIDSVEVTKDRRATVQWLEWGFQKGWLKEPRYLKLHESAVLFADNGGVEGFEALKKSLSFHEQSLRLESIVARRAVALADAQVIEARRALTPVNNLEMDYPESLEAHYLRGRYLRLEKKFPEAQSYFNRVREELGSVKRFQDSDLRDEFLYVGASNLLSYQRTDEALKWLEWAEKIEGLPKTMGDQLEVLRLETIRKESIR